MTTKASKAVSMNVAVIGCGYVGLVTGVCLAAIGHRVVCVDNDPEKLKTLRAGGVPIYEPGLKELMRQVRRDKRIRFSGSIREATRASDIIFIAVGTPSKKSGEADLTYVENVARSIAQAMNGYKLIVEKSTVPADTGRRIRRTVMLNLPRRLRERGDFSFDVASNPEFLREGSAIDDFMNPDRVVIGVESQKAERLLRELYAPLRCRMVVTDITSAEVIKHASNSFLAAKISFVNALSQICDRLGADVLKVTEAMGLDHRIGSAFLRAGIGYGGSCFPKDVDAFIRLCEDVGYDFTLLKEVRRVNDEQWRSFVRRVEDGLWILRDKTIAVWGLAFKPNTDDMRNAPAIPIVEALRREGARIRVYDPQAMRQARKMLKNVTFASNKYEAVRQADALLILTEWDEFHEADFKRVKRLMRHPVIFDGRNHLADLDLGAMGFEIHGVGRGEKRTS